MRHLREWIEHNILLELAAAPFSKEDAALVPEAGACVNCSKRTGHNTLLFEGMTHTDQCSDPKCYAVKLDAHVKQAVAAKPKLVQISTAYGRPAEGSQVVPRNRYVEVRQDKPQRKGQENAPEYKTCKYTSEAIVTEGSEKGEIRKVCANPDCPVHHPKKQQQRTQKADAAYKAQQEKRRKEEAIANTTGLRVLSAIADAIPVRLMKRDLLFVAEHMVDLLEENRVVILARQHGISKTKENEPTVKLISAFLRRSDEGTLGRFVVEAAVLLASLRGNAAQALREAATVYKVDIEAITAKVKREFAERETKSVKKATAKSAFKSPAKPVKKRVAA